MYSNSSMPFQRTFYDDAIISPTDRKILLLEIGILSQIGPEGDSIRPLLDELPLSELVGLLEKHHCSLKVVPDDPPKTNDTPIE